MSYRIAYQENGKTEYLYFDYMMQIGEAIRGVLKDTPDWYVEVLGADNEYYPITTVYNGGL